MPSSSTRSASSPRASSCSESANRSRQPQVSDRSTDASRACGTSSRRASASCSATLTSAPRPAARQPPTSSEASHSRSLSCSPCANSDLSCGLIGLVFSVGAVGSLLAAFTTTRVTRRFGIGPTSIVVAALFAPSWLLWALAPEGNDAIPFLVAAQLVFGFTVVVYNIAQVSYRQAICPPQAPGAHELRHALHRVGDDPARNDLRWRARNLDRAPRDHGDRRYRWRPRVPLAPLLASASPPRPARADRRRRSPAGHGRSATVSGCPSSRRSKPGFASSTRW